MGGVHMLIVVPTSGSWAGQLSLRSDGASVKNLPTIELGGALSNRSVIASNNAKEPSSAMEQREVIEVSKSSCCQRDI